MQQANIYIKIYVCTLITSHIPFTNKADKHCAHFQWTLNICINGHVHSTLQTVPNHYNLTMYFLIYLQEQKMLHTSVLNIHPTGP